MFPAAAGFIHLLAMGTGFATLGWALPLNSDPPPSPVRLVFIHHSVGQAWLTDDYGNLLRELNNNNYYVTDTNYGWGPEALDLGWGNIGDHTDTGHWYNWFLGTRRDTYLAALYSNTDLTPDVGTNSIPKPAGPNTVIMFKSCYPNSGGISGNPGDPPRQSSADNPNPLWGADAYTNEAVTVSNIKGLYRDLLQYFATRQDKLFVLITPPPVIPDDQFVEGSSDRARAIDNWLVTHWLDNYPHNNVAVFDFFNIQTSNGGNVDINDLGAVGGNHHRLRNGQVQHVVGVSQNYAAYPNGDGSHPTAAGDQKATGEFLPLLNVAYHCWKGSGGRPWYMGRSPNSQAARDLLLN
jgi:hypothetical protein